MKLTSRKQLLNEAEQTLKSLREVDEVSPQVKQFAEKLAKMTDENQHSEALYELAKFLKDKRSMTIFKGILDIHNALGQLTDPLSDLRYEQYKILLDLAKRKLKPLEFTLVRSSL
jgi:hypothetical protein